MQPFQIKTITIKQCMNCGTAWSAERAVLEPLDQVNIATIRISYCPVCAESFSAEANRPTYKRTGKRIK